MGKTIPAKPRNHQYHQSIKNCKLDIFCANCSMHFCINCEKMAWCNNSNGAVGLTRLAHFFGCIFGHVETSSVLHMQAILFENNFPGTVKRLGRQFSPPELQMRTVPTAQNNSKQIIMEL